MSAPPPTREAALERVMQLRERERARPAPVRALLAALGLLLMIVAAPLAVVLPEVGVPVVIVALRLLAVEFDWAARGYAWVTWRWGRLRAWFRARSRTARALDILLVVVLLVLFVRLVA